MYNYDWLSSIKIKFAKHNKNYFKTLLFDSNYVINDDIKESTLDNE